MFSAAHLYGMRRNDLVQLQRLSALLLRQNKSSSATTETMLSSTANIDSLIVLDRKVDMITPLLTQLTYEGLLDELIGIKNCSSTCPFDP